MKGNRPVLLLVVGILVSANFAFPKAFRSGTTDSFTYADLIPILTKKQKQNKKLAVFYRLNLAGERGCVLAAPSVLSLPRICEQPAFYQFILSVRLSLISRAVLMPLLIIPLLSFQIQSSHLCILLCPLGV